MAPGRSGLGHTSITAAGYLEKIDQLFACNVGEHVPLPQIVVFGDRSCGKSSILEAITKISFPRDSGLCTKYTTQIISRRAAVKQIKASIIPAADSDAEHIDVVRAWHKDDLDLLDREQFLSTLSEVNDIMGIGQGKTFSNDVLRIEICSPAEQHLSIIDIPGIFRTPSAESGTTKADVGLVRSIVESYMENPRSIILAVIPANVDPATQEILQMAEYYDPDGQRTLGILTKPDLVDEGAEPRVLELLQGIRHKLKLGWAVLRNPGQKQIEDPSFDRDASERTFFQTTRPWNTVEKAKVGIESLRTKLQEILTGHVRREFPKVKLEIARKLREATQSLDKLGPNRESHSDQQRHLLAIATEFQRLASLAVKADYSEKLFRDDENTRLATLVVQRNEALAEDFQKFGHQINFATGTRSASGTGGNGSRDVPPPVEASEIAEDYAFENKTRNQPDHVDMVELLAGRQVLEHPQDSDIYEWLTDTYKSYRGFEIGTFPSSLIASVIREQCSVPMKRSKRYEKAIEHVKFLVKVEQEHPLTLNHYFSDTLEKIRRGRMDDTVPMEKVGALPNFDNAEHTVQDIHDILKSYYKTARKRFVDNICMQGAQYHVIDGPDTPLKVFSPRFVTELSDSQIEEIAGEDLRTRRSRKFLNKTIADLNEGRRILG